MRATMLHAPGLVRVEDVPDPVIEAQTDAILRVVVTCVCGSDLWWYRGANGDRGPRAMGHEYLGIVEEVGSEVRGLHRGDHVLGSFIASDGTCDVCLNGYPSRCRNGVGIEGAQAEFVRIPLADGTLVVLPGEPDAGHVAGLLALSDVASTGWFAAVAGRVEAGSTVAVTGDGAVGLLAVLAANRMGAARIIAMSRTTSRQALARRFGATDVVEARGDEGAAAVRERTDGTGVDSALECVGTPRRWPRRSRPHASADRWASSACRTASRSPAERSSTRSSRCRAGRHPFGASCPNSSTSSAPTTTIRGRSSTSNSRSSRLQRPITRWTSGGPSRCCCGRDAVAPAPVPAPAPAPTPTPPLPPRSNSSSNVLTQTPAGWTKTCSGPNRTRVRRRRSNSNSNVLTRTPAGWAKTCSGPHRTRVRRRPANSSRNVLTQTPGG